MWNICVKSARKKSHRNMYQLWFDSFLLPRNVSEGKFCYLFHGRFGLKPQRENPFFHSSFSSCENVETISGMATEILCNIYHRSPQNSARHERKRTKDFSREISIEAEKNIFEFSVRIVQPQFGKCTEKIVSPTRTTEESFEIWIRKMECFVFSFKELLTILETTKFERKWR